MPSGLPAGRSANRRRKATDFAMNRFPVLALDEMTPEQRAVADAIAAGPRGGVKGPVVALLHNPALAERVQALGEYLRFQTRLPNTLIELAILVIARHWSCRHEWYAHEKLARKAGLDGAIIDAIAERRVPQPMTPPEALVHRFCNEAIAGGEPSEAAFDDAVQAFGRDGVLDLLALCGYYSLLALVLNTAKLAVPDDGGRPLPP